VRIAPQDAKGNGASLPPAIATRARRLAFPRASDCAAGQSIKLSKKSGRDHRFKFAAIGMLDLQSACDGPDPMLIVHSPGYQPPDQRESGRIQALRP